MHADIETDTQTDRQEIFFSALFGKFKNYSERNGPEICGLGLSDEDRDQL
jgi:hypothetical protein